jgi:thiamine biosynthesis protein ThiS
MRITVNGEPMEMEDATTVEGLFKTLGVKTAGAAVELNGEIVARSAYAATVLKSGDAVEIVRMVGGGKG